MFWPSSKTFILIVLDFYFGFENFDSFFEFEFDIFYGDSSFDPLLFIKGFDAEYRMITGNFI